MPPEPSVTSACEGPRLCTLRYLSALLPKSFERPGPKSVSPATYCSGVEVVVWCRGIVDMRAPFAPETPGTVDTTHTGFYRQLAIASASTETRRGLRPQRVPAAPTRRSDRPCRPR